MYWYFQNYRKLSYVQTRTIWLNRENFTFFLSFLWRLRQHVSTKWDKTNKSDSKFINFQFWYFDNANFRIPSKYLHHNMFINFYWKFECLHFKRNSFNELRYYCIEFLHFVENLTKSIIFGFFFSKNSLNRSSKQYYLCVRASTYKNTRIVVREQNSTDRSLNIEANFWRIL